MKSKTFGITYGSSGRGKTLAMVRAFPDALFIAPRGALLSASYLGWEPRQLEADASMRVDRITKIIKQKSKDFPAIVIDDFSLISDAEVAACKVARPNGYQAFDMFNKKVMEMKDAARNADCHVFLTMHEQAPREVKKPGQTRWIPGSPLIAGWQLPEKLPAIADFVARIVHKPSSHSGWPYVYDASGRDPEYITKDRLGVMPDIGFPMNLREILIAGGYDLPRPKELAWMEPHVERISEIFLSEMQKKNANKREVLRAQLPELRSVGNNTPSEHIRWVLADAVDRAYIKKHKLSQVDLFIDSL